MEYKPTPELDKAILRAQDDLFQVIKDVTGNYGKYASKTAILKTVAPALKKVGVSISGSYDFIEGILCLVVVVSHTESGQHKQSIWPLDIDAHSKNKFQARGAATTYGIRYVLEALFMLPCNDEDDRDGESLTVEEKSTQAQTDSELISDKQVYMFKKRLATIPEPKQTEVLQAVFRRAMVNDASQIKRSKFQSILSYLKENGAKE